MVLFETNIFHFVIFIDLPFFKNLLFCWTQRFCTNSHQFSVFLSCYPTNTMCTQVRYISSSTRFLLNKTIAFEQNVESSVKKKLEKSNLKKIIMFEFYAVLSFSTHVKYVRTFKYRVVYLYMIINLRCNHQHLCTNFTNIDDHVYIF